MATKSENSDIAVLQTQMIEVKQTLSEIKEDIHAISDSLNSKYVTKAEFVAFKASYWVRMIASAILGALLTALVVFFFSHVNLKSSTTNNTTTTTTTTSPSGTSTSSSPSATAHSEAQSTPANPNASDSSSSGGVGITVPKL